MSNTSELVERQKPSLQTPSNIDPQGRALPQRARNSSETAFLDTWPGRVMTHQLAPNQSRGIRLARGIEYGQIREFPLWIQLTSPDLKCLSRRIGSEGGVLRRSACLWPLPFFSLRFWWPIFNLNGSF